MKLRLLPKPQKNVRLTAQLISSVVKQRETQSYHQDNEKLINVDEKRLLSRRMQPTCRNSSRKKMQGEQG